MSTVPGGYAQMSGTSMATPHVAAAVALLRQAAPTLTADQVIATLRATADDLGAPGIDNQFGAGRIDVYAAIKSVLGAPPTTTLVKAPPSIVSRGKVTFQVAGQGATVFRARIDGKRWSAPQTTATVTVSLPGGRHSVQVQAVASNGFIDPDRCDPRRDRRQGRAQGPRPEGAPRRARRARREGRQPGMAHQAERDPLVGRPPRPDRRVRRALPVDGDGAGQLGHEGDDPRRLRAPRVNQPSPYTPPGGAPCAASGSLPLQRPPVALPHPAVVPLRIAEGSAGPRDGESPRNRTLGGSPCPRSPCASSSKPASTSATRRAAGTRRCAASSSRSAAASTSSTCSRRSQLLEQAHDFVRNVAARGGTVLFVGTKKQAQDADPRRGRPRRHAVRQPPLARWPADELPHHLRRIERLHDLRRQRADGQLDLLPTKERMRTCASSRSSRSTSAASPTCAACRRPCS